MPTPSLKDRLIDKLREIEDPALLAEVSNLFELQEPESIYKTTPAQKKAIEDRVQQSQDGLTISGKQSDNEIEQFITSL